MRSKVFPSFMKLIIKPKNRELAEIEVVEREGTKKTTIRKNIPTSLLKAIDKMLNGQKPQNIMVDVSETSFSAERIGLAIGKTLEFAWGIELRIIA